MTRKAMQKRIGKIATELGSFPVPPKLVQEGRKRFRETGELPTDVRLASTIVRQIHDGFGVTCNERGEVDWGRTMMEAVHVKPREKDPVMDGLRNEAAHATGMVQAAARQMLIALAKVGFDVTEQQFVGWDLPEFGGVGTMLMGIDKRLVKRPYVRQGRRLLRRTEKVGRSQPQEDRRWNERVDQAFDEFQHQGIRPDDPRILELILVIGEWHTLMRHYGGEDVRELMAVFDAAARTKGEERDRWIGELQTRAVEGRLHAQDA